jgi:SpoVK/Ycf46/Vps4 family AAA+-type ATPase
VATAEQLKALMSSYSAGDDERFRSIALQIAAQAARTGQKRLAEELQAVIDAARPGRGIDTAPSPVPIARVGGELAGLVASSFPKTRVSDMVLDADTRGKLERVLREYRQSDLLRSRGLRPRRKLLLVGPPGCGKTMTASALAGELSLPLLSVQLHGLITKFMGETAAKLSLIFEAMSRTRGVYLFDEFDAIGSTRNSANDVGEIRRVLNSFLQFLEQENSDSLVVAATNIIGILDPALFRRFDDVIEYGLPTRAMARQLIENRLAPFTERELDWPKVAAAAVGHNHAEIVRACEDAAKEVLLAGGETITTVELVQALKQRPLAFTRPRRRKSRGG